MELNSLTAISPLDGRYRQKVNELDLYFSEFGLIKYRLMVEIEYFIALCDIPLPQLSDFKKKITRHFDQYMRTLRLSMLKKSRRGKKLPIMM